MGLQNLFPWQAFVHTPGKFTCIDMFAGRARISKAFTEIGHKVCTLDISRNEADDPCIYKIIWMLGLTLCLWASLLYLWFVLIPWIPKDILEPKGFCRHLLAVLQLATTGLVVMGIPCSTWITINRNSPKSQVWTNIVDCCGSKWFFDVYSFLDIEKASILLVLTHTWFTKEFPFWGWIANGYLKNRISWEVPLPTNKKTIDVYYIWRHHPPCNVWYVKSKPNQTLVFEVLARSEEEQVIAQKTVLLDRNSLAISGYMNGI